MLLVSSPWFISKVTVTVGRSASFVVSVNSAPGTYPELRSEVDTAKRPSHDPAGTFHSVKGRAMTPRNLIQHRGGRETGGVFLVLLVVALILGGLAVTAVVLLSDHSGKETGQDLVARVECMNSLRRFGEMMRGRTEEGSLELLAGAALFLQGAGDFQDEDLVAFLCRGDPRYEELTSDHPALVAMFRSDLKTAPCSYRGPDAQLLREAIEIPGADRAIIACDLNGPDGNEPHHANGICVLWNTMKVDFIRWEHMEGYAGGPVQVGPGSPDPRFRHLIP
jgi:hypothetical protein